MKMMSRTSVMSTRGVTLIPVIASSSSWIWPAIRLDLPVGARDVQPRRDGIPQRLRAPDHALQQPLEDVVGEHGRDRYEEANRGGDQRLRDSGRYGGGSHGARRPRGEIGERADDAQHGPEQSDEGSVVAERAQHEEPALVFEAAPVDGRRDRL